MWFLFTNELPSRVHFMSQVTHLFNRQYHLHSTSAVRLWDAEILTIFYHFYYYLLLICLFQLHSLKRNMIFHSEYRCQFLFTIYTDRDKSNESTFAMVLIIYKIVLSSWAIKSIYLRLKIVCVQLRTEGVRPDQIGSRYFMRIHPNASNLSTICACSRYFFFWKV